MEEPGRPQMTI